MLKKMETPFINFQSDQELFLCLQRLATAERLENWTQLQQFLTQQKITNLAELNQFMRSSRCNFELGLVYQELLIRFKQLDNHTLRSFYSSAQVGEYLINYFKGASQEKLLVIYLDTKNHVLAEKIIFQGSLNKTIVHPREIYKQAILFNSAALIMAHNHPSGDVTPSREDLEFSKKVRKSGKILGIECFDHFVVGENRYLSLQEQDLL